MPNHRDNPGAHSKHAARHGIAEPRGQRLGAGSRGGRFGRMFAFLPERDPGERAIEELVDYLDTDEALKPGGNNFEIPAGYTYLGQFIDHDITFDPSSKLQRDNDPGALVNFRTPRLDLDSLYGSGPADQPFLYDWDATPHRGVRLLVDRPDEDALATVDLPRNVPGRALIGDARNDENLIVSQLHLLFIRFHNAVVTWLAEQPEWQPDGERPVSGPLFEEAQRIVRWHYQWIVTHDFLRRIAGSHMAQSVLREDSEDLAPHVVRRFFRWHGEPAIPVEFSGAAYRFGHSMVRDSYRIRSRVPPANLFAGGEGGLEDLGGFRRLPRTLEVDWDRFFFTGTPNGANHSMTIDTGIVGALFRLPREAAPLGPKLALLNLQRGRALALPAGRDVANAMSVEPLSDEELLPASATPAPISQASRDALLRATPLWFYILREAELLGKGRDGEGGQRLGPVGGRIVAEVLAGLIEADPHSYLRQWPTWKPGIEAPAEDFTMLDLLAFVRTHEAAP